MLHTCARTRLLSASSFILLLFFVTGCRKWHTKKLVQQPVKSRELKRSYTLGIDGIECKQCICTILRKLRDSKLINYAECTCPKDDYAQAKITCFVDKVTKFSVPEIKKVLEHEQFVLQAVTGDFSGTIVQKPQANCADRLFFVSPEIGHEAALAYDAHYLDTEKPLAPTEKKVSLFGTLLLEKNQLVISAKK